MKKLTQAEFDELTRKQKVEYVASLDERKAEEWYEPFSVTRALLKKKIKDAGIKCAAHILHTALIKIRHRMDRPCPGKYSAKYFD